MRILHLSDLHIDKNLIQDQRIVLRALFSDLAQEVIKNGEFDLVVFTGDLIAKGAYTEDNIELAINEFICPLIAAARIDKSKFFMVPGNHDVDLKSQSGILAKAQRSLAGNEEISNHLSEVIQPDGLKNGFEKFNKLYNDYVKAPSLVNNSHYRSYVLTLGSLKVGIAALNSAWRSTGAAHDGDYGKLLIGVKQIEDVLESLQDVDIRLALLHHPINWLIPKETQQLHRQLLLHFDALFHGHNHESDAQFIYGSSNNYFISNSGCLYQSRDYFNGYCICTFQEQQRSWELRAREYIETRQVFDVSLRFAPNGIAAFSKPPTRACY